MATPRSQRIGIWIIVIAIAVGTVGTYFAVALGNKNDAKDQEAYNKALADYQKEQAKCPTGEVAELKQDPAPTAPSSPTYADIPELKTEDITVGTGAEVKAGDCVEIFYHGILAANGKAFTGGDNYITGVPYRALTTGFVPGFAQGLVGMKEGGERRILIPSELGYKDKAQGEIPANSDLIFVVKLVSIYKPS